MNRLHASAAVDNSVSNYIAISHFKCLLNDSSIESLVRLRSESHYTRIFQQNFSHYKQKTNAVLGMTVKRLANYAIDLVHFHLLSSYTSNITSLKNQHVL